MAGEAELDAEFRGAVERIRIMGEQDVGYIAANERLDVGEHLHFAAARHAFTLVIDAHQVQLRALVIDDGVFAAEHFHACLLVKALGEVFGAGINLVIAIAAIDTERGMQAADFVDTIVDRVVNAGNEVAGDNGEVRAYVIGHIYGAAHGITAHIAAQVNVGNLDDFHAV